MAEAPVGQATLPAAGAPPVAAGCGVAPECETVISVQTMLLKVSTEKEPVPSELRIYLPTQSNTTSQVLPSLVSVVARVWPVRLPAPSETKKPTRKISWRAAE